ncbi:MAG: undecaprenyl-diphosphatase UppP [Candidatus Kerfeldbacteria bacterium]|nr:undecaprenyl-diphosphatase UppP [Candidatus Kerfeldbacteria bacterium]
MNHLFDAAILGTVQGLTEFLPVSSSGHLLLAHEFLNYEAGDSLTFDVALHIGTLIALLAYFWRDIVVLGRSWIQSFTVRPLTQAHRLPWLIGLAALPAALAGAAFESFFESMRNPWIVVATFIIFGFIFLLVEHRRQEPTGTVETTTWKMALGVGLAQVLALVPGVSRSGVTIVAGLLAGFRRDQAARFTFLLSIPVVAGAAAKKMIDLKDAPPPADERAAMLLGIAVAAIVGYAVIRFLLKFLGKHRLDVFAYYRFGLAIVTAVALLAR